MTSPYKLGFAFALLSLLGAGCAADDETDADSSSQDVIGTFKSYAPEKAVERLKVYFPASLYQGTTPDGDDCTMTVSRNDETRLIAVSMGLFPKSGYERTRFEVHPETKVSNWTDRTIGLDFDVHFTNDDAQDTNAHVTIVAPKKQTSSVKVTFGDRAYECANLNVTRAPIR